MLVDASGFLVLGRKRVDFVVGLLKGLLGTLKLVGRVSDYLIKTGVLCGELTQLSHKRDLVALDFIVLRTDLIKV